MEVENIEKVEPVATRRKKVVPSTTKVDTKVDTGGVPAKLKLGMYKRNKDVGCPVWGSPGSACFDLRACLFAGEEVLVFSKSNIKRKIRSKHVASQNKDCIILDAGDRALIPTGLIFDIPEGHSLRVHPRSGMTFKYGLSLSNCEGIIDYDYVDELFISVINLSSARVIIANGDRIAQCELIEVMLSGNIDIENLKSKPKHKTSRTGGFGSTGKR